MNKKIILAIIFVLLSICCAIPAGLWIYSAANTKPTCDIVAYSGENSLSTYKTTSINDALEIPFEVNSVKTVFMGKSTELFGTGKDYKCPESLKDLNIITSKTTRGGKSFEIIYKKLSDYTAQLGAKIDGKEYYLSKYTAPTLE